MAERKMGTLWSGKFEFFVPEKNTKQRFKGLKLAISDFFIAPLFDESKKKNYFIYTLRNTSAENLMLGSIAVCLH